MAELELQPSRVQLHSAQFVAGQHDDSNRLLSGQLLQQWQSGQQLEAALAAAPQQRQQAHHLASALDIPAASAPSSRLPRPGFQAQSVPLQMQLAMLTTNAVRPSASRSLIGREQGNDPGTSARAERVCAPGDVTSKPDIDNISANDASNSLLSRRKEKALFGMARAVTSAAPSGVASHASAAQAVSKPPKPLSNSKV